MRLVRAADQLTHSSRFDGEGAVRAHLQKVDETCEDFSVKMEARRKELALAVAFFVQSNSVSYTNL